MTPIPGLTLMLCQACLLYSESNQGLDLAQPKDRYPNRLPAGMV